MFIASLVIAAVICACCMPFVWAKVESDFIGYLGVYIFSTLMMTMLIYWLLMPSVI